MQVLNELQLDALGEIFNIGVGRAASSLSLIVNDAVQLTAPSTGFLPCTLRRFFGSSPAFASARVRSITCSGACTTT